VAKIILGSHAQVNKDFLGGVDPGKPLPVNGSEQTRQHGVDHDAMTTTGLGREVTKKNRKRSCPASTGAALSVCVKGRTTSLIQTHCVNIM
jgi:hypothetical protein